MKRRDDFADAVQMIRDSRAWAIIDGLTWVWRAAARDSWFVSNLARARRGFEALSREGRRQAIAVTAAVAALFHACLLGLVPPPLKPAVPRWFWLVVSAAAAIAAVRRSGGKDQARDA